MSSLTVCGPSQHREKFIQVQCRLTSCPTRTQYTHTSRHMDTQWPHCTVLLQQYPSRMPDKSEAPRDPAGSGWQCSTEAWVLQIMLVYGRERIGGWQHLRVLTTKHLDLQCLSKHNFYQSYYFQVLQLCQDACRLLVSD